jgi:hypothetical protein
MSDRNAASLEPRPVLVDWVHDVDVEGALDHKLDLPEWN